MAKIPFIKEDSEIISTVEKIINVDEIMESLRSSGNLEVNSLDYEEACFGMCKIFTDIIGEKLSSFYNPNDIIIKEGVYGVMEDHTWLEINGVIIDATLLQFERDAKKLNFIENSFNEDNFYYMSIL